jgi:hypothetical protein
VHGERHDPESGFWHPQNFHPASDWSQAGPIVSNEWYVIEDILVEWFGADWISVSAIVVDPLKWFMRAYVASQYGNDVEELIVSDFADSRTPDMGTPSRFGAVRSLLSSQWSSLAGH